MKLVMSPQAIAVVRLPVGVPDPEWARGEPLVSVTRTARETSVIVPTSSVPEDVPGPVQGPLVGVYVDELLDFSQVGILVGLLKPLADAGIPVLTVSTYDTDWVLVEASRAAAASSVWRAAGYQVVDASRPGADDLDEDDEKPDETLADDETDADHADDLSDADEESDSDSDSDSDQPVVVDVRDGAPDVVRVGPAKDAKNVTDPRNAKNTKHSRHPRKDSR